MQVPISWHCPACGVAALRIQAQLEGGEGKAKGLANEIHSACVEAIAKDAFRGTGIARDSMLNRYVSQML